VSKRSEASEPFDRYIFEVFEGVELFKCVARLGETPDPPPLSAALGSPAQQAGRWMLVGYFLMDGDALP